MNLNKMVIGDVIVIADEKVKTKFQGPGLEINSTNESLDSLIKKHINTYTVADDPYEVAVEIGKKYEWTQKQIEQAEKILRKKYLK